MDDENSGEESDGISQAAKNYTAEEHVDLAVTSPKNKKLKIKSIILMALTSVLSFSLAKRD